jgi:hypothetical protein
MPRHRAPQRSPQVNLALLRLILALRNRGAMASTGAADRRGHCLPKTRQLRHADQVDLAVLVALKTCAHAAAGLSRQAARVSCVRSRGFWLRPARRADARARTSPVSAGRAGRRSPRGLGDETRLPTDPGFVPRWPAVTSSRLPPTETCTSARVSRWQPPPRVTASSEPSGIQPNPASTPGTVNDHVRRPVGGEGDHLASEHFRGPQPAFMPARELQERKHPRTDPGPH